LIRRTNVQILFIIAYFGEKMEPLVSILIPAYNVEKWIGDTIRSSLSQTWPRKEIIIVNDGSSDNTLEVAKQFESKTLKVISQQNSGASAARNKALEHAQGDYIQWLDADDLLHPEKISLQLEGSEDGRSSRTLFTCSWGIFYYRLQKSKFVPDVLWQDAAPVDWIIGKFTHGAWMNPAVWLVSRRLTELAGPWDERLSISGDDDGEYICRVVAASDKVKFVRNAKSYYRLTGYNQLSKTSNEKSDEAKLLSIALSIDHLRSLEDSERTRKASLILLQSMHELFYYADRFNLLEKNNMIAHKLNGELTLPKLGRQWDAMSRLIGRRTTMYIMNSARKYKFMTKINWDRLLYNMNR
jgi:glycosyltransferase involved in cell wall biosynthesis